MLVRPLINRELLRECRRTMHFVARTVFVLALALYVAWRWIGIGAYGQQNVQTLMARYGTSLFIGWAVVQYVVIWALSTIRAASLADERRIGSLQLMRATALLDRGVIVGWFLSVMGRALFTMALALPVLVMSRSFGGFTMGQVWVVLLITIATAAVSAAFTLCIAATSNSTGNALISSVVLQALALTGVFVLDDQLRVMSLVTLEGPALLSNTIRSVSFGFKHLPMFLAIRLVLTALWLCLAIRLLKRPPARFGRPVKRMLVAADRFFLRFSNHKAILWRSGLGECKRNPILWRERAVSVLGQRDHVIRIWYTPVIVLIAMTLLALVFFGDEIALVLLVTGLVGIPVLLTALFLIVPPAMAFVRERQQQTLGLLAATPLSAREIVLGKYYFCLRRFTVPLALGVVFVILAIMALGSWPDVEERIPLLLLPAFVPLFLAEMLFVTQGVRSTGKAIVAAAVTLTAVAQLANPELVTEMFRDGDDLLLLPNMVYVPAMAFLAVAAVLAKRMRVMRNGFFLCGMTCALLLSVGMLTIRHDLMHEYGFGLPILSIALIVAVVRAMRFAGPGVVNRTVLTIMLHWLVIGWLSALGTWIPGMWILMIPVIALMTHVFLKMRRRMP